MSENKDIIENKAILDVKNDVDAQKYIDFLRTNDGKSLEGKYKVIESDINIEDDRENTNSAVRKFINAALDRYFTGKVNNIGGEESLKDIMIMIKNWKEANGTLYRDVIEENGKYLFENPSRGVFNNLEVSRYRLGNEFPDQTEPLNDEEVKKYLKYKEDKKLAEDCQEVFLQAYIIAENKITNLIVDYAQSHPNKDNTADSTFIVDQIIKKTFEPGSSQELRDYLFKDSSGKNLEAELGLDTKAVDAIFSSTKIEDFTSALWSYMFHTRGKAGHRENIIRRLLEIMEDTRTQNNEEEREFAGRYQKKGSQETAGEFEKKNPGVFEITNRVINSIKEQNWIINSGLDFSKVEDKKIILLHIQAALMKKGILIDGFDQGKFKSINTQNNLSRTYDHIVKRLRTREDVVKILQALDLYIGELNVEPKVIVDYAKGAGFTWDKFYEVKSDRKTLEGYSTYNKEAYDKFYKLARENRDILYPDLPEGEFVLEEAVDKDLKIYFENCHGVAGWNYEAFVKKMAEKNTIVRKDKQNIVDSFVKTKKDGMSEEEKNKLKEEAKKAFLKKNETIITNKKSEIDQKINNLQKSIFDKKKEYEEQKQGEKTNRQIAEEKVLNNDDLINIIKNDLNQKYRVEFDKSWDSFFAFDVNEFLNEEHKEEIDEGVEKILAERKEEEKKDRYNEAFGKFAKEEISNGSKELIEFLKKDENILKKANNTALDIMVKKHPELMSGLEKHLKETMGKNRKSNEPKFIAWKAKETLNHINAQIDKDQDSVKFKKELESLIEIEIAKSIDTNNGEQSQVLEDQFMKSEAFMNLEKNVEELSIRDQKIQLIEAKKVMLKKIYKGLTEEEVDKILEKAVDKKLEERKDKESNIYKVYILPEIEEELDNGFIESNSEVATIMEEIKKLGEEKNKIEAELIKNGEKEISEIGKNIVIKKVKDIIEKHELNNESYREQAVGILYGSVRNGDSYQSDYKKYSEEIINNSEEYDKVLSQLILTENLVIDVARIKEIINGEDNEEKVVLLGKIDELIQRKFEVSGNGKTHLGGISNQGIDSLTEELKLRAVEKELFPGKESIIEQKTDKAVVTEDQIKRVYDMMNIFGQVKDVNDAVDAYKYLVTKSRRMDLKISDYINIQGEGKKPIEIKVGMLDVEKNLHAMSEYQARKLTNTILNEYSGKLKEKGFFKKIKNGFKLEGKRWLEGADEYNSYNSIRCLLESLYKNEPLSADSQKILKELQSRNLIPNDLEQFRNDTCKEFDALIESSFGFTDTLSEKKYKYDESNEIDGIYAEKLNDAVKEYFTNPNKKTLNMNICDIRREMSQDNRYKDKNLHDNIESEIVKAYEEHSEGITEMDIENMQLKAYLIDDNKGALNTDFKCTLINKLAKRVGKSKVANKTTAILGHLGIHFSVAAATSIAYSVATRQASRVISLLGVPFLGGAIYGAARKVGESRRRGNEVDFRIEQGDITESSEKTKDEEKLYEIFKNKSKDFSYTEIAEKGKNIVAMMKNPDETMLDKDHRCQRCLDDLVSFIAELEERLYYGRKQNRSFITYTNVSAVNREEAQIFKLISELKKQYVDLKLENSGDKYFSQPPLNSTGYASLSAQDKILKHLNESFLAGERVKVNIQLQALLDEEEKVFRGFQIKKGVKGAVIAGSFAAAFTGAFELVKMGIGSIGGGGGTVSEVLKGAEKKFQIGGKDKAFKVPDDVYDSITKKHPNGFNSDDEFIKALESEGLKINKDPSTITTPGSTTNTPVAPGGGVTGGGSGYEYFVEQNKGNFYEVKESRLFHYGTASKTVTEMNENHLLFGGHNGQFSDGKVGYNVSKMFNNFSSQTSTESGEISGDAIKTACEKGKLFMGVYLNGHGGNVIKIPIDSNGDIKIDLDDPKMGGLYKQLFQMNGDKLECKAKVIAVMMERSEGKVDILASIGGKNSANPDFLIPNPPLKTPDIIIENPGLLEKLPVSDNGMDWVVIPLITDPRIKISSDRGYKQTEVAPLFATEKKDNFIKNDNAGTNFYSGMANQEFRLNSFVKPLVEKKESNDILTGCDVAVKETRDNIVDTMYKVNNQKTGQIDKLEDSVDPINFDSFKEKNKEFCGTSRIKEKEYEDKLASGDIKLNKTGEISEMKFENEDLTDLKDKLPNLRSLKATNCSISGELPFGIKKLDFDKVSSKNDLDLGTMKLEEIDMNRCENLEIKNLSYSSSTLEKFIIDEQSSTSIGTGEMDFSTFNNLRYFQAVISNEPGKWPNNPINIGPDESKFKFRILNSSFDTSKLNVLSSWKGFVVKGKEDSNTIGTI